MSLLESFSFDLFQTVVQQKCMVLGRWTCECPFSGTVLLLRLSPLPRLHYGLCFAAAFRVTFGFVDLSHNCSTSPNVSWVLQSDSTACIFCVTLTILPHLTVMWHHLSFADSGVRCDDSVVAGQHCSPLWKFLPAETLSVCVHTYIFMVYSSLSSLKSLWIPD